jgi:UDP-N-acetylglucosamine--N-acetylmuramyl-(pentapeptide) pyrophosphoryl-undecaprenol N-acetylglucosamine transferase
VVVSFRQTLAAFRGKGYLLGNPVRAALSSVGPEKPPGAPFRLLVFGGSRGSHALNEAAAAALPALKGLPGGIEIVHQTGAEDLAWVQEVYAKQELTARVEPFISDMENAYAWCHAVLCRAGATTLAELAAVRRPALLVPFPFAAGAHQLANAKGLEALGAALCVEQRDLTPDSLLSAIRELADKEVRARMAKALSAAAKPRAAEDIARLVRLAGGLT